MSLTIKHISSDIQLEEISKDWKDLDNKLQHHNICSSYTWIYNWWEIFKNIDNNKLGYNKQLTIICGFDKDELVFVFPLMKVYRKKLGVKISFIEFIGQQWSGIYYDIVIKKDYEARLTDIEDYLYQQFKFDCLFLRYIPQSSVYSMNNKLFRFAECPEIKLFNYKSFDSYVKENYKKGHKQNLRTGKNRALKNGDVLEGFVDVLDDEKMDSIIQLSKSKLQDSKSWVYGDKNKLEFYKKIYKEFESNVILIKVNGKDVAYRTNIFFNNMKLCVDASYDRQAPKYELGIRSVDKNIDDSFNKNMDIHSMGPGIDAYKLKFTKYKKQLYWFYRRGNSFKSIIVSPFLSILLKRNMS